MIGSDYAGWVMTVELECFAYSVRFIRVFECGMHINVWAFLII